MLCRKVSEGNTGSWHLSCWLRSLHPLVNQLPTFEDTPCRWPPTPMSAPVHSLSAPWQTPARLWQWPAMRGGRVSGVPGSTYTWYRVVAAPASPKSAMTIVRTLMPFIWSVRHRPSPSPIMDLRVPDAARQCLC